MGELTTEEMGRLRVPLAELPGLDPEGLRLTLIGEEWYGSPLCTLGGDADVHVANAPKHAISDRRYAARKRDTVALDLRDPATADRCARWLAGRVGLAVGCTAPTLAHDPALGGWSIGTWDDAIERLVWRFVIEDSATLDPADPRLLPDGSRWVDRVALAEVCRHVGRTP